MVSCLSTLSIQRIKAMLLCIEYGILFVNTVDTKIKACNALNAMFVETVGKLRLRAFQPYHQYYICLYCQYKTRISNAKHIHTFLPITFLIFNRFSIRKKFWKAETQGFSTIPSVLYMLILSIQDKDL